MHVPWAITKFNYPLLTPSTTSPDANPRHPSTRRRQKRRKLNPQVRSSIPRLVSPFPRSAPESGRWQLTVKRQSRFTGNCCSLPVADPPPPPAPWRRHRRRSSECSAGGFLEMINKRCRTWHLSIHVSPLIRLRSSERTTFALPNRASRANRGKTGPNNDTDVSRLFKYRC